MSNLLPVGLSPTVYYFRLFLDELYKDFGIGQKVCIISNTTIADFNVFGWYPYATGSNEAVSYNKDVQSSPTYISGVPRSVISRDVILSRQLIGTTFTLDAQSVYPNRLVYPLMKGVIGSITGDDFSSRLELISENEKLKSQGILKVSQDCMNTLGVGKCTVSNPVILREVVSVTTRNTLDLASPFVSSFDPLAEYEVTIGTTSYLVDKAASSVSNLRIVGNILGKPQFVKVKKHCNQSLIQCGKYNNLSQFNGNPFLTASVLNISI
jgi:hypothetical protein